ncbi:MAG: 50S ribosomal protein L13 [Candidatus Micrarchaeota archaeon]
MKIYDGKGIVAGRLAAKIVKSILVGEQVIVANARDLVLSGTLKFQTEKLKVRRSLKDKRNPENSVKYPRTPHLLFKKIVKGMLPKKTRRGREALKRLKVYNDVPSDVDMKNAVSDPALARKDLFKSTTMGKLCGAFGFKS